MPNLVMLDGIIQNTWTYNDVLHARLVHYEPDGSRGYYLAIFPEVVQMKETDAQGSLSQRRVQLNRRNLDRVAKGVAVVVTGKLTHRDERVGLADFAKRARDGSGLDEADHITLTALAAKVGQENRAVVEIAVHELTFI